jgi:hypothetical protein
MEIIEATMGADTLVPPEVNVWPERTLGVFHPWAARSGNPRPELLKTPGKSGGMVFKKLATALF